MSRHCPPTPSYRWLNVAWSTSIDGDREFLSELHSLLGGHYTLSNLDSRSTAGKQAELTHLRGQKRINLAASSHTGNFLPFTAAAFVVVVVRGSVPEEKKKTSKNKTTEPLRRMEQKEKEVRKLDLNPVCAASKRDEP